MVLSKGIQILTPPILVIFQKEPLKPYQIEVQFKVLRLNVHKLHGLKEVLSILMKDAYVQKLAQDCCLP